MLEFFLAVGCGLAGGLARAAYGRRLDPPSRETDENGRAFLDPGIVGTLVLGVVAGVVAWLFNANSANPGIDWRPLGWALIAGFGADLALDAYVSQKLGLADRQDTGSVLDEVAGEAVEAANSATTEVNRAHEERRRLEQRVKDLEARVRELEEENARLWE